MQAKNRYEIELGKGVGLIKLGMARQEVISIFGEPKSSYSDNLYLSDYYDFSRLRIDYNTNTEICLAIEISDSELIYKDKYQNIDLLSLSWERLFSWMLENDPHLDIRDDTFISHVLKISTGPKLDEESGIEVAESIVTFVEGYWPSEEYMAAAVERYVQSVPSAKDSAKELGLEAFF